VGGANKVLVSLCSCIYLLKGDLGKKGDRSIDITPKNFLEKISASTMEFKINKILHLPV